ncbi:hypothetical protein GOB94_12745 [Granulicella sp. 5B5]|nr:hypothetical protein GOB94_12745 [Granulicella sp. 5B5]
MFFLTTVLAPGLHAQQAAVVSLPDAPSPTTAVAPRPMDDAPRQVAEVATEPTLSLDPAPALAATSSSSLDDGQQQTPQGHPEPEDATKHKRSSLLGDNTDANGNPIPLERQQPKRILGFMPNFRTVSAGAAVHPPGWKYNFTVATHQATDYSTFVFLGLTSLTAEAQNSHPSLGKGADGYWAYTWRGFLDKTDGTYLSAWLLASALHEDTRYYPMGSGHPVAVRALYVISRQAVSKTYDGHDTPAFATLGGKALTQYISRFYYPTSSEGFGVLFAKFGYSVMRDVAFSSIREFYPDIAAYYIHKHDRKVAVQAAHDAASSGVTR